MPERAADRLIIVSRSMPPDTGGYQRQFTLLAPHFAAVFTGLDWIGAVRDPPAGQVHVPGVDRMVQVPAHRIPRPIRGFADLCVVTLAVLDIAARRLRRQPVRLLLLSPTMAFGATLAVVAKLVGAAVIVRYPTSGDLCSRRGRRVGTLARVRAIAPSPLQLTEQAEFPVTLVPNAVELPPPAERRHPEGHHRMLYVGRLIARKRVDLLVEAWRHLHAELPGWTLEIVGDGGSDRDSVEAIIREQATAYDTSGIRMHGRVKDARVLMQDADVFVFPSSREGMPNSLLEALASGLPVVAERRRAAEWFAEVPPLIDWDGTVEGLVDTLRRVAIDHELRRRVGDEGRAFAERHHAPVVAAQAIAALG